MQFHLDGFQVGDPRIRPADPVAAARPAELPAEVDVLIVGLRSGRAGAGRSAREVPGHHDAASSSAGRVRSSSARPTASPAARWRCSRPSGSARSWSLRPTG